LGWTGTKEQDLVEIHADQIAAGAATKSLTNCTKLRDYRFSSEA
jgi:hypothetical protein